ncbi:MAG: TIGR01212 family radical SAM protein [Erysipelotrichales bacterium]|nr:TIGR01212 family radical SAM protein [Erysipelotrichales bacterium]
MKNNPFPYSDDNKRYYTWNYYLKKTYNNKVFKVPLDAHFTCPNRDGKKAYGGCTFCSARGSGDFTSVADNLDAQFNDGLAMMKRKWPDGLAMAYFQAYSNTYGDVEALKNIYEPFVARDDIVAISIATRSDCIDEEIAQYLGTIAKRKPLWIELGLQTIHSKSDLNRHETIEEFENALTLLRQQNINVTVHIMNSLPNESVEDMLATARFIASHDIQALKIHMLHIMEQTIMGEQYKKEPFTLLTREEYISTVVRQLEILPPTLIIQRLTGDAPKDLLIEPTWTLNKTTILNDIDKLMVKEDTWQGKYYTSEKPQND